MEPGVGFRPVGSKGTEFFVLSSGSRCNSHPVRRRCMRLPKREEKRRFWESIRAGASRTEAVVAAGVGDTSAKRWFLQAGGGLPPNVPEASSGRARSITEQKEIFFGVERGETSRRIPQRGGRAPPP